MTSERAGQQAAHLILPVSLLLPQLLLQRSLVCLQSCILLLQRLILLGKSLMLLIQAEKLSRHLLMLLPVISEGLLSSITPGNLRLPLKQSKALVSIG